MKADTPLKLPFELPPRPPVTRVRLAAKPGARPAARARLRHGAGAGRGYSDIVDYIVRITDDIWIRRAIGLIYETYDHACTVYGSQGIVRSVEEVVENTVLSLEGFSDPRIQHVNIAWREEPDGYYTSHLGLSRSKNTGYSIFGPASQRQVSVHFVADCVTADQRIHTEWLVRESGALLRQMGVGLHETARVLAQVPAREPWVVCPETRLIGQMPRIELDLPATSVDGWARHLFHNLWNLRRLDLIERYYSAEVLAYCAGGQRRKGRRQLGDQMVALQAALPDGVMRVDHVCHAEEADGVIVAVRWVLEGTLHPGGMFGVPPAGRSVSVMGVSHLRLAGPLVCEEWFMFDELGMLVQAYRT